MARRGTMAASGLDPVAAARTRVEVCQRLGAKPDPRDLELVTLHDLEALAGRVCRKR